MSPKNKKNLKILRKRLDTIDSKMLNIIKKRSIIVKKVLTLKKYKNQIVDKKRILVILKKIRKESLKKNIDPKITKRIWMNMIWSFIDYERRNFKKK
tara:strand:+ start:1251 stop:1541 length:291 start_codon:yes stop_codon:yes gene_type:complete